MTSSLDDDRSGLWAITTFFNPAGYRRRGENYRVFRERLGVPLLTVELSFGGPFELNQDDADILVQRRGGDVMWQKERLFNIALSALPPECRSVAFLDCDIVFDRMDWADQTVAALGDHPLVHLYERIQFMPRDLPSGRLAIEASEGHLESLVAAVAGGLDPNSVLSAMSETNNAIYARGTAWAGRREVVESTGFFDVCIIGGGDTAFVTSLYGCHDFLRQRHHASEAEHAAYLDWSARLLTAMANGRPGHIPGDILHLWHGSLADRRRATRHAGLARFDFDPSRDIAIGESGAWVWASDKPDLHAYVRDYFTGRREDG
ncbi:MAG: hypothetical protein KDK07_16805 [Bauldia sp.]|nr:hypothetical protein [Bauldia sp.]